jgi:hypothetical protein
MAESTRRLIVLAPRDGRVDRQLRTDPPPGADRVVVDTRQPGSSGRIELPIPGRVVYALPSPEGLVRERDELRAAVAAAGAGTEPLVISLEAASELRSDELDAALDAMRHTERDVILVVLGDG